MVLRLSLNDCGLKDDSFSEILSAVLAQRQLRGLSYQNNGLGPKSFEKLKSILSPGVSSMALQELNLCGVSGLTVQMTRDLTRVLSVDTKYIQKIRIANVSLDDAEVVGNLCTTIASLPFLYSLALEWACIRGKYLCQIASELVKNSQRAHEHQVRSVSLAYNNINTRKTIIKPGPDPKKKKSKVPEPEEIDIDYKELFVKTFTEYVRGAESVNHIDLSGMGLESVEDRQQLLNLAVALANAPALQAIHLSGNHICADPSFYEDFIGFFGIPLRDPLEGDKQCRK